MVKVDILVINSPVESVVMVPLTFTMLPTIKFCEKGMATLKTLFDVFSAKKLVFKS